MGVSDLMSDDLIVASHEQAIRRDSFFDELMIVVIVL
jgi:hypothetical protein